MTETLPERRHHNHPAAERAILALRLSCLALQELDYAHENDCSEEYCACEDAGPFAHVLEIFTSCLESVIVPFDEVDYILSRRKGDLDTQQRYCWDLLRKRMPSELSAAPVKSPAPRVEKPDSPAVMVVNPFYR